MVNHGIRSDIRKSLAFCSYYVLALTSHFMLKPLNIVHFAARWWIAWLWVWIQVEHRIYNTCFVCPSEVLYAGMLISITEWMGICEGPKLWCLFPGELLHVIQRFDMDIEMNFNSISAEWPEIYLSKRHLCALCRQNSTLTLKFFAFSILNFAFDKLVHILLDNFMHQQIFS